MPEEKKPDGENTQEDKHAALRAQSADQLVEYIERLRDENKTTRLKAAEYEKKLADEAAARKVEEEKKLVDDGKLKELLTVKEKEIAALKAIEEKNKSYEGFFSKQLEEKLKTLSETQREMITDSGQDLAKKLEWADKLNAERGIGTDSPGGTPSRKDSSLSLVQKFKDAKNTQERAAILFEAEKFDKAAYKEILAMEV